MSLRVDEGWLEAYRKRNAQAAPARSPSEGQPRRKYGNEPTQDADGERFDSKHELRVYNELRLRGQAGEFRGLARQVTFYLPGGVKYIADFVALNNDGSYDVYDAKSAATRKDKAYRIKRRLMQNCLGIEIQEM